MTDDNTHTGIYWHPRMYMRKKPTGIELAIYTAVLLYLLYDTADVNTAL